MSVLLRSTDQLPDTGSYDYWLAVTGTPALPDTKRGLPDQAKRLESAFEAISNVWWQTAHRIGKTPSGEYSYALACSPVASDFGLMLAWCHLTAELATEKSSHLVVCDDPWLFRQISLISNVQAGKSPSLWPSRIKGWFRGLATRSLLMIRLSITCLLAKRQCRNHKEGKSFLLVYGHPESSPDGHDAYFGNLMREIPALKRLLHTDCPLGRSRELAADGKTASLHGWGSLGFPVRLLFVRWRPTDRDCSGEFGWLIRRAATIEGSGGAHAMTEWTRHCLVNWTRAIKPERVAWPWENLPWERLLVRITRALGITSIGYQHADVGPHQYNMSPSGNPDGLAGIPDKIILNGKGYRDQLIAWGVPEKRMQEGGAFRTAPTKGVSFDPLGPIFVALSGLLPIAEQMIKTVSDVNDRGFKFVIKEHPMYPVAFEETENMQRTNKSLSDIGGVSAVLYGTGMSGLDGILAGIPTYRLLFNDRISLNSLPDQFSAISVTAGELENALGVSCAPPEKRWQDLFSSADLSVWREALITKHSHN